MFAGRKNVKFLYLGLPQSWVSLGPTIGVPGGQDKLDPITIYETIKIKLMLSRDGLEVPDKEDVNGEEEDDDTYREWLIKVGVTAILD